VVGVVSRNGARISHMERGDSVIVRVFGGEVVTRRFWAVGERLIYVTTDDGLRRLAEGDEDAPVIGFPPEDVSTELDHS
jgi:hypothetical protein